MPVSCLTATGIEYANLHLYITHHQLSISVCPQAYQHLTQGLVPWRKWSQIQISPVWTQAKCTYTRQTIMHFLCGVCITCDSYISGSDWPLLVMHMSIKNSYCKVEQTLCLWLHSSNLSKSVNKRLTFHSKKLRYGSALCVKFTTDTHSKRQADLFIPWSLINLKLMLQPEKIGAISHRLQSQQVYVLRKFSSQSCVL